MTQYSELDVEIFWKIYISGGRYVRRVIKRLHFEQYQEDKWFDCGVEAVPKSEQQLL